ncbi:MAG TPA: hypothetical protein PKD05_14065, partial [Candidatus Melainabacteria bacterium]|nr:hypothetical protein [Candidatus Melainabacteria bacterium]HMP52674.1 hypothetical protein [Candidatus Melainabacteria bacterium]
MVFDKIALAKKKISWEKAISENRVQQVIVNKDGSIVVRKLVEATINGETVVDAVIDQYDGNDVTGRALLEVVGPLAPGESRIIYPSAEDSAKAKDEIYTPELLEFRLSSGDYASAEIDASGHITLERYSKAIGNPIRVTFSKPDLLEVIVRFTGPLEVGQVYEFQQLSD